MQNIMSHYSLAHCYSGGKVKQGQADWGCHYFFLVRSYFRENIVEWGRTRCTDYMIDILLNPRKHHPSGDKEHTHAAFQTSFVLLVITSCHTIPVSFCTSCLKSVVCIFYAWESYNHSRRRFFWSTYSMNTSMLMGENWRRATPLSQNERWDLGRKSSTSLIGQPSCDVIVVNRPKGVTAWCSRGKSESRDQSLLEDKPGVRMENQNP